MKKVEVFVVGGAKCGTTWLHNMLGQRTDVSMPDQKETHFFSYLGQSVKFSGPHDDENTNKYTVKDLATYQSLFKDEGKRWIEICPSYLYVKGAAENIYRYNSLAKIMIILRNPVDRAWSNYQHLVRDGAEDKTFEEALMLEEERSKAGWVWFWDIYQQGFYTYQVTEYLSRFSKENIYVVRFEDIQQDPEKFMQGVERFIGLSPYKYRASADKNESGIPVSRMRGLHRFLFKPGPVNQFLRRQLPVKMRKKMAAGFKRVVMRKSDLQEKTRNQLSQQYSEDRRALEQLLGMDFSEWAEE